MNEFIVYKATSPSGKVYVGVTGKNLRSRRKEHESLSKSKTTKRVFQSALQKYNLNFSWSILESNLSKDEADFLEKYYIKQHNSTNRNFGYNQSPGGFSGAIMSPQGKKNWEEKMSQRIKNSEYIAKITKHLKTPEHRAKLTQGYKAFQKTLDYLEYRKNLNKIVAESAKNIQKRKKCAKTLGAKPFKCNETGEIFELLSVAAERFGVDRRQIHNCLKKPNRYKTILKKYTFNYIGQLPENSTVI